MSNNFKIEKLSDREHILRRPSMYIGGISNESQEQFVFDKETKSLQVKSTTINPGLIKIINEVIDNSIDAILKFKVGSRIDVDIGNMYFQVSDNSSGFPFKGTLDEQEPVVVALGNARAGSNFNDESNIGQLGTNGVGAFATNCFSNLFSVVTDNGKNRTQTFWHNNGIFESITERKTTGKSHTIVRSEPDLKRFQLDKITDDIKDSIKTRLMCLAYTYPKINFYFNDEKLEAPKNITEWLNVGEDPYVVHKTDDYEVFVVARSQSMPNFSFVNGLNIKDGGSHLDVILNDISKGFSNLRGFQEVSKADISNTLQLIFVGSRFKNLRFNSQTKEKITNSAAEVREYLGSLDTLVSKVTKSKEIKDFIKATKDSRELRANKSKLTQTKKAKIKSDKFLDAQESRDYLMLVEGDSALGGLLPALGRKNIAYYALKGKPLNAWSSTTQKLTQNKELSELLSIVHNSEFKKIVIGTDQDLDGFHIRGLLLGFIYKYLPEYQDKVYFLNTPVRGVTKDDKLIRWSFNLSDDLKIKSSERSQYFKGLGTFDKEDLKHVLDTEGFDKLTQKIDINKENTAHFDILESWLGNDSQKRKDFILENDFSIAKI